MTQKTGKIIIISSPSGGGKTSICSRLLTPGRKRQGWSFSLSYTTRAKRLNERNGREYAFVGEQEFNKLAGKDFFAEHCQVHLYHYGTPRGPLEKVIKAGGVMILDVDVQGAFKLKKEYPQAVTIFILPPSIRELKRRLIRRGTESAEQLRVRFENAKKEMKLFRRFEYCVINRELNTAVNEVLAIIASHHCRTDRLPEEQITGLLV